MVERLLLDKWFVKPNVSKIDNEKSLHFLVVQSILLKTLQCIHLNLLVYFGQSLSERIF